MPNVYIPGDLTSLPTANVTTPDPILVADVHYQYTPLFFNFFTGPIDFWACGLWPVRSVNPAAAPQNHTPRTIRQRPRACGPMSMMRRFPRMTSVARDQRGGVALMFGVLLLPTLMVVGLAVDYSFYVQAQSQLNLGADAAALHAVRAASSAFSISKDATAALQAGDTAGRQWFASQVGLLNTASVQISTLPIVTYTQSPPGFSGAVSYSGTVASHLGAAFGFLPDRGKRKRRRLGLLCRGPDVAR